MKAVILAAGRGRRMGYLTKDLPKPLLKVRGKTLLDHIFESLPKNINEVIVVIGYKGDQIRLHLEKYYGTKKLLHFIHVKELHKIAQSVLAVSKFFPESTKERFLIIYGDELPNRIEMKQCLAHRYSWLCHQINKSISAGAVKLGKNKRILEVKEKRMGNKPPFLAAGGGMLVDSDIFGYKPRLHKSSKEYHVTSIMGQFIKDHQVYAVVGRPDWYLTSSKDIDRANKTP